MAPTTDTPTSVPRGGGPSPTRDLRMGRERPLGGFERWMWLCMRISGLVLLILAVGHVLIMHVTKEGVGRVNFGFVATRWQSPFWRTWDWMLLVLALIHGINGLRVITLDYVRRPGMRLTINMFFYVVGFTLVVLGTVIVFTFGQAKGTGTT